MNIKLGFFVLFLVCLFSGNFIAAQSSSPNNMANDDSLRGRLIKLPWAEKEVRNISQIAAGSFYLRDKATETMFKEQAPDAGIIHLATHAIIDDEHPLYSKFVFTKEDDSNGGGTGMPY